MQIVTWNVNSIRSRLNHLLKWAEHAAPDIICLQETKCQEDRFPTQALADAGFPHQAVLGQRAYNGVAILSRRPLDAVSTGFSDPDLQDGQARLVQATVDGVRIVNVYVPNGQRVGSEKFAYKLEWLGRLRKEFDAFDPTGPLVLCGDMNVALTDLDVHDPFEAEGKVLYHPAERAALQRVLDWGLVDAYRHLEPKGTDFTWWDYRRGAYPRNHGFRIDHVFVSQALLPRLSEVAIWKEVRGWPTPSDHVPVSLMLRP